MNILNRIFAVLGWILGLGIVGLCIWALGIGKLIFIVVFGVAWCLLLNMKVPKM